jgi:hypothetical protein
MKLLSTILILSAILYGFAVTNAGAITLTPYNNRTAWENAVSGFFIEEDFNSFTTGVSYEFSPVDVGDFNVSVNGQTFDNIHNVGQPTTSNDVNGTPQINAATGYTGGTTLAFDFPILAFGADWDGVSDNRTTSIQVAGVGLSIPNLEPGFFGFVADEMFSSAQLILTSGGSDGFAIDNAVYSPIPIPGTILLLGSGLVFLAGLRRKFRKN